MNAWFPKFVTTYANQIGAAVSAVLLGTPNDRSWYNNSSLTYFFHPPRDAAVHTLMFLAISCLVILLSKDWVVSTPVSLGELYVITEFKDDNSIAVNFVYCVSTVWGASQSDVSGDVRFMLPRLKSFSPENTYFKYFCKFLALVGCVYEHLRWVRAS